MSVRVQTWVWEHSDTNGNDRLVLLAIADEANDDGTNAYPSMETLAHKCRVNKATVMRAIRRLEEIGELSVERPTEYGRGRYNIYTVVMGKVAESNPSQKGRGRARKGAEGRAQEPPNPLTPRPLDPPTPIRAANSEDCFDEFWSVYPRKESKPDARNAWKRAVKKAPPLAIIEATRRYAEDPNRLAQYTPYAQKWLNNERWNDPPCPSRTGRVAPEQFEQAAQRAQARRDAGVPNLFASPAIAAVD